MNHSGYIYIMTNKNRTTLYIGVTNDLCRRIYEHKNHLIKGSFTDKYNLEYCIYYEEFPYFDLAIQREKELKKWNRQKKEDLINKKNPEWKVLVTEKGFVREKVSIAQQVNHLLNELQHNGEIPPVRRNDSAQCMNDEIPPFSRNDDAQCMNDKIPPCGRNDNSPCGEMSEGSGGFAATCFTTLKEPPIIPNETKCSEESPFSCQPPVIPHETNNQKFDNTTKET
ncbi:MAG TPA: GIY-YIG nuclease family protein [Paludibacteraceae bacterium]|nr:GIY-YIG nuclease family protein [Paludibacteraceae bacterium]